MLPFVVQIKTGEPASAQVVYAATRAIVAGEMVTGQPFPSVRELSQALKINPNTAHKIVAELVREGLLEVMPGVGTVVATLKTNLTDAHRKSVEALTETLVLDARRAGVSKTELLALVTAQWKSLFGQTSSRRNTRPNDD